MEVAPQPRHNQCGNETDDGDVGPDAAALFRRRHGGLIWRVGVDLRVDPVTTATAALYFQRFFLAQKEGEFDATRVAMASVWLASKVREDGLKLRDIVNSFLALEASDRANDSLMRMEAYWLLRDELVLHEQALLRTMASDRANDSLMRMEAYWLLR